jgi:Asp-tRNA(Asn)/Glu-tRNA(Gln) amidotransferase A subunit family amidase
MSSLPRRSFLVQLGATGAASPVLLFPSVLAAALQEATDITPEVILDAAEVAGLDISREDAIAMVEEVTELLARYQEIHEAPIGNEVPLPLHFDPRVPGITIDRTPAPVRASSSEVTRPTDLESVAFWPITDLAHLIETRQVTAVELTEMYLGRLARHGPTLNCVVTLTPDRARARAAQADEEISAGRYRGHLHGIPYGVKDIIAVRDYPTTWGAAPFADRVIDQDATVVERLDAAGAVLVAKLTTGELAFGDRWFGGRTNSPWNPEVGSSGSSAGSGAATAAGLVGFAIGTDTGGSILSPSQRCGVVGLRPTFGRVSRHGVMAAGTTLDKVGPMCRSAEGAALVLHAIAGPDDRDFSVPDFPVHWNADMDATGLRVGYLEYAFDAEEDAEYRRHHTTVLDLVRARWGDPVPVELPASNLNFFLEYVERAAGFDEFLRSGLEEQLVRPVHGMELRANHLVPAVEYLQANRLRQLLMEDVEQALGDVDVVLAPHGVWWHPRLSLNAVSSSTGHPVVAVPTGLRSNGTPLGVTLMGRLYREGDLLSVAQRLLDATGFAEERPRLFS